MCRSGLERFDFEKSPCRASNFAPTGTAPRSCRRSGALHAGSGGGFALHEAVEQRVVGVSAPHVVQFPSSAGGQVSTRGGASPKVQTTSYKHGENGPLWERWTTPWACGLRLGAYAQVP